MGAPPTGGKIVCSEGFGEEDVRSGDLVAKASGMSPEKSAVFPSMSGSDGEPLSLEVTGIGAPSWRPVAAVNRRA